MKNRADKLHKHKCRKKTSKTSVVVSSLSVYLHFVVVLMFHYFDLIFLFYFSNVNILIIINYLVTTNYCY